MIIPDTIKPFKRKKENVCCFFQYLSTRMYCLYSRPWYLQYVFFLPHEQVMSRSFKPINMKQLT